MRKAKPTNLKLITGNPGRRPLNANEPKPKPEIPTPPSELSDDARIEWEYVAGQLYAVGCLTGIDRAALAAYCQAYGRWILAERALAEMAKQDPVTAGLVVKSAKGMSLQNPLVGTANKAMQDFVRYAAEFGMTPSARSRIQAQAPEVEDAAAKYFTR
jgi:P27 family predicted phage terminase small subunit